MWLETTRGERWKKWRNPDTGNQRISMGLVPYHYEDVLDSGRFPHECDMRLRTADRFNELNGVEAKAAGWHFGMQTAPARPGEKPQGLFTFGGRMGAHKFGLRPHRLGYLHWSTRGVQEVMGAPTFSQPTYTANPTTIGIDDADPNRATLHLGFEAAIANLWTTPNGGAARWQVRGNTRSVNNMVVLDQAARDWIAANERPRTPAAETLFGVLYQVDWGDVPRARLNDQPVNIVNNDFEDDSHLTLETTGGRRLAAFGPGFIGVRNRGGHVPVRKRFFLRNGQWWLFVGGRVDQINRNLLRGEMIIDPPITQETITTTSDDASQSGTTMRLGGYNNILYVSYATTGGIGWRFQTVPIDNGATINSASITVEQGAQQNNNRAGGDLHCEDIDDAPTFTTGASNITNRTRTSASVNDPFPDGTNGSDVTSDDLASLVQEVVNRAGWTNNGTNNNLAFLFIGDNTNWKGFDDLNAAGAGSARFDADVAGGNDSIEAATSIAFSQTADLNADGDLAASSAVAFAQTADLEGAGELGASQSIAFGETGDLGADGGLAASESVAFGQAGGLAGDGALAGSQAVAFDQTAALTADGLLAAATAIAFGETADLRNAAAGGIRATAEIAFVASPLLSADGALVASEAVAFGQTGVLVGRAPLAASEAISFSETADLGGIGGLQAVASIDFTEVADLTNSTSGAIQGATTIQFVATGRVVQDSEGGDWLIRQRRRRR